MRHIAFTLLLLGTLAMQAQHIEQGSYWYNGAITYSATLQPGGNVVMSVTDEGEELEFMLVPETGQPGTYRVAPGPNDGYLVYDQGVKVRHVEQEGLNVLCIYDLDGDLQNLFSIRNDNFEQNMNVEHWMEMVRGSYTMQDGTRVTIDWDKANVGGYYMPVEAVTFNGYATGIMHFDGDGTALNGDMEMEPTIEGQVLFPGGFDEYGGFHRLPVDSIVLIETDPYQGRYEFAQHMLLYGNELYDYDLTMLRLMRNSILAHHGYVFQSPDLQEYFGKEPWYKPADNNDNIQLSLLERLNIDIIKTREKNAKKELESGL